MSNEIKSTVPAEVFSVPCERVRPFKKQPRKYFERSRLADLEDSILHQGQIEPALVKRIDGISQYDYELIAGERRWRACSKLGIQLRVVVVPVSSHAEQFALAVISNSGEPFTPMEVCWAMHELRKLPDIQNIRREEQIAAIARIYFGRSQQWAWERWGLLRLTEELQAKVEPTTTDDQRIPVKVAASLATLPPERQDSVLRYVQEEKMIVTEAKAYITHLKRKDNMVVRGRQPPDAYVLFCRVTEMINRELEPFVNLVADDEFQAAIAGHTAQEIRLLGEDLSGLIDRLERLREHVGAADQRKMAS